MCTFCAHRGADGRGPLKTRAWAPGHSQPLNFSLTQLLSRLRRTFSLQVKLIEMRLISILFRNSRQPQNEDKVPFKAITQLQLKDHVSSRNQKTLERGCLHETSLLLTCLEKNEFEDKRCLPQLKALDECFRIYRENVERARSIKEQTVPVPNSKNFTHKQITYLLRRYPTV